jgi:transposase-like protein
MKSRKQNKASNEALRRERRAFTDAYKREAVRLLHERRANGGTVTQVGRELEVRPDQLREWARRLAERE